jgi:hypothetical protein
MWRFTSAENLIRQRSLYEQICDLRLPPNAIRDLGRCSGRRGCRIRLAFAIISLGRPARVGKHHGNGDSVLRVTLSDLMAELVKSASYIASVASSSRLRAYEVALEHTDGAEGTDLAAKPPDGQHKKGDWDFQF